MGQPPGRGAPIGVGWVRYVRGMQDETRIALMNYDWMVRNRGLDDVELHWDSDTVIYGDGGAVIDELTRAGFTPGTSDQETAQLAADPPGFDR